MHDFLLAKEIVDTALEHAKKNKLKKISRIVVSLGKFNEHDEDILPENLKHNFQLLAEGTALSSAKITVKSIKQVGIWRLEEIEGE